MPILARTQESCRDVLSFCNPVPIGPGPALNAASAKGQTEYVDPNGSSLQGIPLPDPGERNPTVALHRYISANRPEVIVGILLVFIISLIALVCWVRFDENARKRFQKYWRAMAARVSALTKRSKSAPQLPASGTSSPTAPSDISRVSSQATTMHMATNKRPTLDRAPSGSQLSVMKTNQIAVLPVLLARP